MDTKTCSSCHETKSIDQFYKGTKSAKCKHCHSTRAKDYYKNNSTVVLARSKEWYETNAEAGKRRAKQWKLANRERKKQLNRESAERCRARDPEKARAKEREWYRRNPDKVKAKVQRQRATPGQRLNEAMSHGVWRCLRKGKESRSWTKLVPWTPEQLMEHLERQFKPGMTWDNYGRRGWHVDHIRPLASFTFTTSEDDAFKQAWALDNLQPLWETENLKKSSKTSI